MVSCSAKAETGVSATMNSAIDKTNVTRFAALTMRRV